MPWHRRLSLWRGWAIAATAAAPLAIGLQIVPLKTTSSFAEIAQLSGPGDASGRGGVGGPQDARAARDASGARRPVAELRALADPRRRRRAGLARRAGQPRCEARAAAGAGGAPHARRKARGVGRARRRLADRDRGGTVRTPA